MVKRVLPLLFALAALPAGAAPTFYTGTNGATSGFNTALTAAGLVGGSFVDFMGLSSSTTLSNVAGTGVSFTGSTSLNVDPSGFITLSGAGVQTLQVTAISSVYAIGFYISGTGGAYNWTYGPSGGTISLSNAATAFLGVISELPLAALPTITLVESVGNNHGVIVDSFQVGTAALSETPEPSSMALIGSGLLVLPLMARRARRRLGAGR